MIKWISSWAQSIIVAVIIGTIIEMILPEGKNKKYIKVIIGIYILFTITVPIINKFTKTPISIDTSKYETYLTSSYQLDNIDTKVNSNIEDVYKQNLKKDITEKLKHKKYEVLKIEVNIELKNQNNYGNINKISLNVKKSSKQTSIVKKVENVNINTGENIEEIEETISASERTELKKYLSEEYKINEENIIIF